MDRGIRRGARIGVVGLAALLASLGVKVVHPGGQKVPDCLARVGDQFADLEEPVGSFVGVWSISDDGDVPPRWKIGGPKSTLKNPRGVALEPKHKELIVADMRLNAILTYYFPEIF